MYDSIQQSIASNPSIQNINFHLSDMSIDELAEAYTYLRRQNYPISTKKNIGVVYRTLRCNSLDIDSNNLYLEEREADKQLKESDQALTDTMSLHSRILSIETALNSQGSRYTILSRIFVDVHKSFMENIQSLIFSTAIIIFSFQIKDILVFLFKESKIFFHANTI